MELLEGHAVKHEDLLPQPHALLLPKHHIARAAHIQPKEAKLGKGSFHCRDSAVASSLDRCSLVQNNPARVAQLTTLPLTAIVPGGKQRLRKREERCQVEKEQ